MERIAADGSGCKIAAPFETDLELGPRETPLRNKGKKMRYIFGLVVLLVLSAASGTTFAAETFNAYGIGRMTCGKYLQDIQADSSERTAYSWWIAGFISHANMSKRRWTTVDQSGLEAWAKQYCTEHPLEMFMTAAMRLDAELDHHKAPQA